MIRCRDGDASPTLRYHDGSTQNSAPNFLHRGSRQLCATCGRKRVQQSTGQDARTVRSAACTLTHRPSCALSIWGWQLCCRELCREPRIDCSSRARTPVTRGEGSSWSTLLDPLSPAPLPPGGGRFLYCATTASGNKPRQRRMFARDTRPSGRSRARGKTHVVYAAFLARKLWCAARRHVMYTGHAPPVATLRRCVRPLLAKAPEERPILQGRGDLLAPARSHDENGG